ncbi:hypothetical protein [Ruminococcus flavefaciens]|jgi:hypothetical protein|uniref:hypothetical protein n=1 Tax=Ruminococcus flavefaciens TaxID=1265 RepID=UPI0026EF7E85|nr:hypothetical protein [Ruminococcus flavefaciens]MBQ6211652.1 hypothetical protein [Ruminococcus sp.]
MDRKKPKNNKVTRYSNSVIYYKSLSCRASIYEDRLITDYCNHNRLSKSVFLAAAAMYCIKNNIAAKELLNSTTTSENFDFRDYMQDEYDE